MKSIGSTLKVKESGSPDVSKTGHEEGPDAQDVNPRRRAHVSTKRIKKNTALTSALGDAGQSTGSGQTMTSSEPVVRTKKSASTDVSAAKANAVMDKLLEAAAEQSAEKLSKAVGEMGQMGLRFDQAPLSSSEKVKKVANNILTEVLKDCGNSIPDPIADLSLRLLRLGCNPNGSDSHGNTPLMMSCKAGRKDLVSVLLTQCPTVKRDAVNADGRNAAMVANEAGHKHLLLMLDKAGIPRRPTNPAINFLTLVQHVKGEADYADRVDTVMNFLQQGEFLNLVDDSGKTLLMHATIHGDIDLLNALVRFGHGPMVHIRDAEGKNVFDHAEALNDKPLGKAIKKLIYDTMQ